MIRRLMIDDPRHCIESQKGLRPPREDPVKTDSYGRSLRHRYDSYLKMGPRLVKYFLQ